MTRIGIIGVGYLGECLAEGLAKAGDPPLLSPRSRERVARLSDQYGCAVADSNADLVDRSDLVFLATRPGDISTTAQGLPWRAGQRVVSVAAGIGLPAIRDVVAPALAFRSMPLAAGRILESPTGFCPPDPVVAAVFEKIGTAHAFAEEAAFETASIFGAYYALVYAFLDEVSGWAAGHGLEPETARVMTARMAQAAASVVIDAKDRAPGDLLNDLLTPGGITEAGLAVLTETGALRRWSDALDASLTRSRDIDAARPKPAENEKDGN